MTMRKHIAASPSITQVVVESHGDQGVETDRLSVTVAVGVPETADMAFTVSLNRTGERQRSEVFSQPISEREFFPRLTVPESLDRSGIRSR